MMHQSYEPISQLWISQCGGSTKKTGYNPVWDSFDENGIQVSWSDVAPELAIMSSQIPDQWKHIRAVRRMVRTL